MSKADKMRGRLASIQKDREEFERQRKELEADMSVGRNNMSKINKGLRNNAILEEPISVDSSIGNHSSHSTHNHGKSGTQRSSHPSSRASSNGEGYASLNSPMNAGNSSSPQPAGVAANQSGSNASNNNNSNSNNNGTLSTGANAGTGASGNQLGIMPSGPRVSDWCYSAPLDSPAPPAVKSREMYESVRLLGRGSFGEVNLVKNLEDNKLFAIKTQLCPKDCEFSNVLREVRFLRACRHPCIIDVHDAFLMTNPRIVYIVMHYCESGTVSSVISTTRKNKATLAENQVLKWVLQLGLAMQFLHDNHVVHRDLKPMNVMLTEGGDSLKLADFGLAMTITEKEEEANTDEAGTPYYTAPEMIQREPYSYPADCWSFGVIVHQLLALERPFEGNSTADLVKSILSADPPPLPVHYSEDIKLISAELLRKDQNERLTMTELLLEPIFHSKLSSFPQSYRPRTLEERIRRSHQKQLEVQVDALQRARKADGVKTVHDKVHQRQLAAEAAIAAATLAAEEAILAAATEVGSPSPLGGSSGVGSPRLGLSRSVSNNNGTRSSTPSRTLATTTSGLRLSAVDAGLTETTQSAVAVAIASSTTVPTATTPTATATATATTTAAIIASATAAGTTTTLDTPLLSQTSQASISSIATTATSTAANAVDRTKSISALGGGTEVAHDAIPEEGGLESSLNSMKICTSSTGAAEQSDNISNKETEESAMIATAGTVAATSQITHPDVAAAADTVAAESSGGGSSPTVESHSTTDMSPRAASTPVLSCSAGARPGSSSGTPHGGRKGQELARAIEHDAHFQQDQQSLPQQNSSRLGSASSPNTPTHRENSFTLPAPIAGTDTPNEANN